MMSRMVIKSPPLRFLKAKEDVGDEEERHEMEDEETSNSMEKNNVIKKENTSIRASR